MSKRICEHIQDDGLRCTNPAMYRREVCFQHWRQLRPDVPPSDPAYVPSFDSEASISNASAHMFRSVLAGKVDLKQGRLALQFLRETARSLRRQRKTGDQSEIHFTSFMADYYSILDEIQAKSAAAYPDPQPLIYPAHFRDLPEDDETDAASSESDDALSSPAPAFRGEGSASSAVEQPGIASSEPDNVGTGALARATRAQLAVPAAAAAPEGSPWRQPWVNANSTSKAPAGATEKKRPLSTTQLKLMKKILRHGPKHPQFKLAARLLDHQICTTG